MPPVNLLRGDGGEASWSMLPWILLAWLKAPPRPFRFKAGAIVPRCPGIRRGPPGRRLPRGACFTAGSLSGDSFTGNGFLPSKSRRRDHDPGPRRRI